MNPDIDDARQILMDRLDDSWLSVSSAALERHGGIVEESKRQIQIISSITIEEQFTSVEIDSSVSQRRSPRSAFEYEIQRNPFTNKREYTYPDPDTVEEQPCNACSKSGRLICDSCNGNGRENCDNCGQNGTVSKRILCESCNGKKNNGGCRICDGSGTVTEKQDCKRCDAKGHVSCRKCGGDGEMTCETCEGEGYIRAFESVTFVVQRDVSVPHLPSWWSSSAHGFAEAADCDTDQLTFGISDQTIEVRSDSEEMTFFKISYAENTHEVAVRDSSSGPKLIWDPETGYPRTSVRRKLGDLKSRLRPFQ